jgi:hypothetical protein
MITFSISLEPKHSPTHFHFAMASFFWLEPPPPHSRVWINRVLEFHASPGIFKGQPALEWGVRGKAPFFKNSPGKPAQKNSNSERLAQNTSVRRREQPACPFETAKRLSKQFQPQKNILAQGRRDSRRGEKE